MTGKKRTEVTIATREVVVIRRTGSVIRSWCAECAAEVRMVTAERAAALSGLSTRAIYRHIESTQIHFIETADGRLWICTHSLQD